LRVLCYVKTFESPPVNVAPVSCTRKQPRLQIKVILNIFDGVHARLASFGSIGLFE
jgi:hypothetical protein